MIVDNLNKIIGVIAGIEIIVIAIFTVSVLYLRNPVMAGIIGNISSLTMIAGIIGFSVKREIK